MILLPETYWEVKLTQQKGRGVFASKDILPGTVIGDYIGKVIKTAEEDTYEKGGLYLMYYHDYASIFPIDTSAPGIHLFNHSCAANCWMYTYHGHTLFFALRKIFAGEELTVSYLLSPDEECDPCTHVCKCGNSFCRKTMHQTHDHFKRWNAFNEAQSKETKRAPIRYGKILSLLPAYPDSIPDHEIYDLIGSISQPPLFMAEESIPSQATIRKYIRESGKTLAFPHLKTRILGILNNHIYTEPMSI